jgi:hypothetical protein
MSPYYRNSGYLEQYGPRFRKFLYEALNDPRHTPPGPPKVARIDAPEKKAKKRA